MREAIVILMVLAVAFLVLPGCVVLPVHTPGEMTIDATESLAAAECEKDMGWRECMNHLRHVQNARTP